MTLPELMDLDFVEMAESMGFFMTPEEFEMYAEEMETLRRQEELYFIEMNDPEEMYA